MRAREPWTLAPAAMNDGSVTEPAAGADRVERRRESWAAPVILYAHRPRTDHKFDRTCARRHVQPMRLGSLWLALLRIRSKARYGTRSVSGTETTTV